MPPATGGELRAARIAPNDAVFIGGTLGGNINFGCGSISENGNGDALIVELDTNGKCLQSQNWGDNGAKAVESLAVDPSGGVAVTGVFESQIDFGGGTMTGPPQGSTSHNVFVARLDAVGQYVAQRDLQSSSGNSGPGEIAVDALGNAFLAGSFDGATDLGGGNMLPAGQRDIFLVKDDPNLVYAWAKRYGDARDQFATTVAVDSLDRIVMGGGTAGNVSFGGGNIVGSTMGTSFFVATLDSSGGFVHQFAPNAVGDYPYALVPTTQPFVVVGGQFQSPIDFGAGPLTPIGPSDGMVARFVP